MRKAPLVFVTLAALAIAATLLLRPKAPSSSWPTKAVTLLVPASAGSGTDLNARLFAARLAELWGQPVVVDNRPGGGDGLLGFSIFAAGKDDHTLLFGISGPITMDALLRDDLPFDATRDFVPIAAASLPTVVIASSTGLPVASLKELELHIKQHPSEYFWSAPGPMRYFFEAFLKTQDLKMTYLPYQSGAAAVQDLGAGRLHVLMSSLLTFEPLLQSGKVRILAATNTNRSPAIATVQTVSEAGYSGLTWDGMFAVFGPRGMPELLCAQIAEDIRTVAREPAIKARLSAMGQTGTEGTPEELANLLNHQRSQFRKIIEILDLKKVVKAP